MTRKKVPVKNRKAVSSVKKEDAKKKMIRNVIIGVLAVVLVVVVIVGIRGGFGSKSESGSLAEVTSEEKDTGGEVEKNATPIESATAIISIKDYGEIEVALDASAAPISVENFISLAEEGFYDGLTFHRIISGFMIQGGDPEGTGMGGSDKQIKGEFSINGVDNPISHTRGVISMARSQDNDSASSQFFIVHEDSPHLDGSYAAFGRVTKGIEIVDKICGDTPVQDGNGTVQEADQPIIESIKIVR